MFFADHYRNSWFNTWEPKWYTGFNVASYPPLAHQILALLSFATGLELAYAIITLLLMVLLPIAIFKFSSVFVSNEASGYASLLSVFFPGIIYAVYIYGQFTTLFGIILALFAVFVFNKYLKSGKIIDLAKAVCLAEATIATHHLTGVFGMPFLLIAAFLAILIRKESNSKALFKRFFLFATIAISFSIIILYPVMFSAVIPNVNVPHPTTFNLFSNLDLLGPFFIDVYGFFLILIPLTILVVLRYKDIQPLFILAIFLFILGLGGTTILPQIIFGQNWLGLTYDRFSLFSVLAFTPLLGLLCTQISQKKKGKTFLAIFLIVCILFAGFVAKDNFTRAHEKEVPVDSLVNFLNTDEHWRYRYLTLGFSTSDFSKLSILTNATTIDGWYYRGRNITALMDSGVSYLSGAKYETNGIPVLKSVLENASQYNLKFVFCNDAYYEPILNETGFIFIANFEQVTLWEKPGIPVLEMDEIAKTNTSTLQDYVWGIVPISWLAIFLILNVPRIYSTVKTHKLPKIFFKKKQDF